MCYAQGPEQDGSSHRRGPVYQRRAFEWKDHHGDKFSRGFHNNKRWSSPQVNSGWFQRPYPYHLDYYKMRYGGSYAPYFGNLYGPPQVVTAPPYYGPYGATFGGFEYANPGDGAYGVGFPPGAGGPMVVDELGEEAPPAAENELPLQQ
jgi:hypothetical protein